MKVKDTIVYVLIEFWPPDCNDSGGQMLYNTGYKTLKRAKQRVKAIQKDTPNNIGIHCIEIEQEET